MPEVVQVLLDPLSLILEGLEYIAALVVLILYRKYMRLRKWHVTWGPARKNASLDYRSTAVRIRRFNGLEGYYHTVAIVDNQDDNFQSKFAEAKAEAKQRQVQLNIK